jgi:HTH-like domain
MRRELAEWAEEAHQLSQRRVAGLIPVDRATLRYEHHRDSQDALRVRLRELAGSRVRYGYRRLTVLLKREGWEVNAKRIYRLYTEEGLIVRTQKRRERAQRQSIALGHAARPASPAFPSLSFPTCGTCPRISRLAQPALSGRGSPKIYLRSSNRSLRPADLALS